VNGADQGFIASNSGNVTLSAFTGSHIGLFDGTKASQYQLVDLTGHNQYIPGSNEPIYGIVQTTTANSPNVLGSYLGTTTPTDPASVNNPELIMAAGNGDVWIADNGSGNVAIGDALLSSDVAGHAMRDPGTFAVSHVFAKAAETIDWATVTDTVDGVKVAKISVLFSYYNQENSNAQLQGTNLQITGSALFGSDVTIAGNLNVTGPTQLSSLTVTGTTTLTSLTVSGNTTLATLTVNGHIITGGVAPTLVAEAGAGSTASISVVGNDTSGTITIVAGTQPTSELIATLTFDKPFTTIPHVTLTPANRDSAQAGVYYDESATTTISTGLYTTQPLQVGSTYKFSYLIVQ
jgi:hypothetical protein